MAKIKVVYSGVSEANNRLQKILREARELSNHIADLQTRIPMEIQSRYQIGEQLHIMTRLTMKLSITIPMSMTIMDTRLKVQCTMNRGLLRSIPYIIAMKMELF